jgi:hypothetical protein
MENSMEIPQKTKSSLEEGGREGGRGEKWGEMAQKCIHI